MKIRNPFRKPPETKQSATGAAMVMNPGQPAWSNRDYAAFADEGYRRNVVVYRSVNMIADAVASVVWTLFRGDTEITESPILDLIKNPNPMQSGKQYMRAKVGFLMIAGNGYEEKVEVGGRIAELYQLRPDRMTVVPGTNGFPICYEYKAGLKTVKFLLDEVGAGDVRQIKLFNPLNDFYGMSPIEAGSYAIDQHNLSMSWVQSLLQNSARPSGALVSKGEQPLSDPQFHKLKEQLEEQHQGAANGGRPMLLEGGLEWQQMGMSPSDMGIIETKYSAARDVALAFGVPPQLLGIPGDNTYANYAEARLAFWEDTVIPLVNMIGEDWNASIADEGTELHPDLDKIPAIADKRMTLWTMADKATDLTINERRELKGFQKIQGGDVLLVGLGLMPLADASTGLGIGETDIDAKAAAHIMGYDVKATD
jgi:HK97 family phage portal protein